MLIHDLILFLGRVGTLKTDKANQTHQMLGLGIKLRSDVSLAQCHSHDRWGRPEQRELHEEFCVKQDGREADELARQSHGSKQDLTTSNRHGISDSDLVCQSKEDVSARETSPALQLDVKDGLTLPEAVTTLGKDLEATDYTKRAEPGSTLSPKISVEQDLELHGRGQSHSHFCLVDKEAKPAFRQWKRETCHNKCAAVTLVKSPSFDAWEKSFERTTKLCNVLFRDCTQSDFTLRSSTCELENVTFINCKFDRTTFMDVKLTDVTFYHVNFSNVTLYRVFLNNVTIFRLQLENFVWRGNYLENALLGNDSLIYPSGDRLDYKFQVKSATSKTKHRYISTPLSMAQLKRERVYGAYGRDIFRMRSTATGNILPRLAKHSDIFDRIMQYCFPGGSTHIFEYPPEVSMPLEKASTNLYFAYSYSGVVRKTTYFGSLQSHTPSKTLGAPIEIPQRGIGNCVGLLLVNQEIHDLALKHVYNRDFHFQCSAEGAREFLLAHRKNMKMVKEVVLYYHWPQDELALGTAINPWRYLLGTIRHQFSFLQTIRLHIGRTFWKRNNINTSGAKVTLSDCSSINCPMTDAYKFAAREDRWRFSGDESTHRSDGTVLKIEIEGTDTQTRADFVKALTDEIEKRRVGRPLFVRSPEGHEITYKCAGQFRSN